MIPEASSDRKQQPKLAYEANIDFKGIGRRALVVIYTPDIDSHGEVTAWVASIVDNTNR